MARRRSGRPGPEYDGPDYDSVYGPPFDPSLGTPVSPPLLRRTRPRDPRLPVLIAAVAVVVIAVVTVFVVRAAGDDKTAAPPVMPTDADVPKGQAARLVEMLSADGFRCAPQFSAAAGARRGCFATRADTILTSAIFEANADGTVGAVRLAARDLSNSPALAARRLAAADDLVELFGPVVFPDDRARLAAALRRPPARLKGAWGTYLLGSSGGMVELRGDRDGRTSLTAVQPVLSTPRTVLVSALTSTGWRCAASCTKTGKGFSTDIRIDGADRLTGLRLTVTGTGPLKATRDGFHARVADLLGLVDGEGVPELVTWLADQRDRGSGSGYVHGWRVSVEARYAGERPTGYELRLSTEPVLAAVR